MITSGYRWAKQHARREKGDGTSTHPHEPKMDKKEKTKQSCPTCVQQKSAARRYRWKLLFCLMPAFMDSCLDLTIVASALPQIASHFGKLNQLNWIVTSFALTSTAFIPVFGQISDTFGRYSGMQLSVGIVLIGSVLCAVAPVWPVLLLGRALQGVGAAGVQNLTIIILADKVDLKTQAVNTSIFQFMSGVGYSVGPVIGGYLANSNWRYCFAVSSALTFISIITLFFIRNDLLPGNVNIDRSAAARSRLQAIWGGMSTLDFGGIILFLLGVGLIILGTAWGGSTFAWSSSAVIVPLVLGGLTLIAFICWEYLLAPSRFLDRRFPNTKPMIPASILSAKDVKLVCLIECGTGAALYSVFYFVGIYFTLVEGYASSSAGLQLLYYIPGLGFGVYLTMFICNVWPRETFWPLSVGTLIETIGISMLCYSVKVRNETLVNVSMAIAGVGTGMRFMPSNLHLAGMFRDRLAAAYSLLRFTIPFGGMLALTVMGSVFQNQMSAYFGSESAHSSFSVHNDASLDDIASLPPSEQDAIRSQGATATMWAFISILPLIALTLIGSLGLGNVWISKRNKSDADETGEPEDTPRDDGLCSQHAGRGIDTIEPKLERVDVVEECYLLALVRGDLQRLKKKGPEETQNAARPPQSRSSESARVSKDIQRHNEQPETPTQPEKVQPPLQ